MKSAASAAVVATALAATTRMLCFGLMVHLFRAFVAFPGEAGHAMKGAVCVHHLSASRSLNLLFFLMGVVQAFSRLSSAQPTKPTWRIFVAYRNLRPHLSLPLPHVHEFPGIRRSLDRDRTARCREPLSLAVLISRRVE